MEPYRVKYIEDTTEIINKILSGTTEFIVNTDDVKHVFEKYNIDFDNEEMNDLLCNGNYNDWFKAANDPEFKYSKELKEYLTAFINRMNEIKEKNKNLYGNMIKIFNPDVEDVWSFKFPEFKEDIVVN